MSLQQRFLLGIVSGAGSVVIKTALNVLLIPVMIHFLGVELYGLYVLLLGLGEMSFILDLGFTAAIVKVLGACRTSENEQEAMEFLQMGHALYALIALITILVGFGLSGWFTQAFHIPEVLQVSARIAFTLVVLECALTLYTCYYRAVLSAHCLHQWANVSDTLFVIVCNTIGLALLMNGYGLVAMMSVRLGAAVIRSVLLIVQALKVEPAAMFPKAPIRLKTLKEIAHLSFHSMVINCSIFISHKVDNFIIAMFLPLRMVGTFEIVFRFLSISQQICSKICEGVFPMFSRMLSMSRTDDVRQLFLRMSNFLNFVVCMTLLPIVSFYPELFKLFSAGKIPIELTIPVLVLAVPCVWTGVLQIPAGYFLFTSGRQGYLSASSFLAAISNLILSVILVQSLGLLGVALGTLIPQFIQHQFSLILETCKDLKIGFKEYMVTVHLRVILPITGAFFCIQAFRLMYYGQTHTITSMGLISVTATIVGTVLWLIFSTDQVERDFLAEKVLTPLKRKLPVRIGAYIG
jgi:O-antigen/teichoic acid export membrane protein